MYQRILVPLDGSPLSEEMLPLALRLAAVHDTELVLLRVGDDTTGARDARSYIDQRAAAYGARGLCVAAPDGSAHAILEEALRVPGTLIALTTHGRSGLRELLLGSVAQRILRGAGGPVLVFRPTGEPEREAQRPRPRRVILPLADMTAPGPITEDAVRFARWLGSSLDVVHVPEPPNAALWPTLPKADDARAELDAVRSAAEALARQHGVECTWGVLRGVPVDALVERVGAGRDALLAMATRRTTALQAALLGSVTAGCLRRAGVPILMRMP